MGVLFKTRPAAPPHLGVVVTHHPPSTKQPDISPGDFILTHAGGFYSVLIRFGQGLRYRGSRARYAHWSHAAMIVARDGTLVEALLWPGVVKNNLTKYRDTEYHLVHVNADPRDRDQAVAFANYCVDQSYGVLTIVALAFSLVFGAKFTFGIDGQEICSGLVARALERIGEIFRDEPWHLPPAGVAEHFKVQPTPNAPIGLRGGHLKTSEHS